MLSPKTNAKLAKALRQLAADQAAGNAPPPGEISREELARRAGISPGTVQNIEIMFAARLAAALFHDPQTPYHLKAIARKASRRLLEKI